MTLVPYWVPSIGSISAAFVFKANKDQPFESSGIALYFIHVSRTLRFNPMRWRISAFSKAGQSGISRLGKEVIKQRCDKANFGLF